MKEAASRLFNQRSVMRTRSMVAESPTRRSTVTNHLELTIRIAISPSKDKKVDINVPELKIFCYLDRLRWLSQFYKEEVKEINYCMSLLTHILIPLST